MVQQPQCGKRQLSTEICAISGVSRGDFLYTLHQTFPTQSSSYKRRANPGVQTHSSQLRKGNIHMQMHIGTNTRASLSEISLARGSMDVCLQILAFWGRKSRNEFIFFSLYKAFPKPKSCWECVEEDGGEEG